LQSASVAAVVRRLLARKSRFSRQAALFLSWCRLFWAFPSPSLARLLKRYGVIFTCLAIRAVHLEIAHSLHADSFLLALQRFIARRGKVSEIHSDNGSNFTRGERELRNAVLEWNQEKIHNSLMQKNIKWSFSPPYVSHFGGIWERCIRTVRKILQSLLR